MPRHTRLQEVGLNEVRVDDRFWAPRLRTNREVTIPHVLDQCEATGRLQRFRAAAGKAEMPPGHFVAPDSDVYKSLEAASYAVGTETDPALEARLDALITLIADAQDADGYLNTKFTGDGASRRWSNLGGPHELYCAGHLFEAAVAHHQVTGKRTLLDVAVKFADHIAATFGPQGRPGAPGHPEIELALVKLYRLTRSQKYLRLAQFFIDQRGTEGSQLHGNAYFQDDAPVREQRDIRGHAVRAMYLMAGVAEVYHETGEQALFEAASRLWDNSAYRKCYITGGVGSRFRDEGFGDDYELPNDLAYAETCAAIGNVFWSRGMLGLTGEGRYADMMERALYNGFLSGVALDGKHFFYVNTLEARTPRSREPWFPVPCCPTNVARMLASLPTYVYSVSEGGLWINPYTAGGCSAAVPGAGKADVTVHTDYPWDGKVEIAVTPTETSSFTLYLRIPAWCSEVTLSAPPGIEHPEPTPGRYLPLAGSWSNGDVVTLEMAMPVRLMQSHPHTGNTGCRALMRGPLLYCIEEADHPGVDLFDIALPADTEWTPSYHGDLLAGVVALHGTGTLCDRHGWERALYRGVGQVKPTEERPVQVTAIPYCVWANRTPGKMRVWMPLSGSSYRNEIHY